MVLSTQIRLGTSFRSKSYSWLWILLTPALVLSGCKNEISDIRALTDTQHLPIQTSYHATYTLSEHGKVTHLLYATQLEQYQGEEEVIIASGGVKVIFYDTLETEEARLTAKEGLYSAQKKQIIAKDSVVLTSKQGEQLETEELIFQEDSARIYTNKFVKITTANGSVLYGNGLESNDSFTKWHIVRPHNGQIVIPEDKEP